MTENEVIEKLKNIKSRIGWEGYKKDCNAIDMAIQTLEEVQEYRATGLTPQMVNDLIKSEKKAHKMALENAHVVDAYRAIGTVAEVKALKEKLENAKEDIRKLLCSEYGPSCDFCIHDENEDAMHQCRAYQMSSVAPLIRLLWE